MNTLTYKDCEELKAAGYKFKEIETDSSHISGIAAMFLTGFANEDYVIFKGVPQIYEVPSLGTLVAETKLKSLTCDYSSDETIAPTEWTAEPYMQDFNEAWISKGATADQAVKNVWLAMHREA